MNILESLILSDTRQYITTILPLTSSAEKDRKLWPGSSLGNFKVANAY